MHGPHKKGKDKCKADIFRNISAFEYTHRKPGTIKLTAVRRPKNIQLSNSGSLHDSQASFISTEPTDSFTGSLG